MPVTSPRSAAELDACYQLRYAVLRQPWGQPPGSERAPDDELPETVQAMYTADDGAVVGVARLHASGPGEAQVRYMAVHPDWQGRGVGQQLLHYLENQARQQGLHTCVLHSRESAVGFYERLGYSVVEPSHTLFGTIPHFLMRKAL
ncbi:GNAT family N-acetyltransferase [Hymenobacter sp. BT175]|uniref:GNAT family N-acetyltransferase n=1 Tax=Hymenobacter translucens TaxID=2886507 RepID=UPI001D0F26F4|nr:GNAT family N-acetyltransferase [Hymenobacter translucens]MCC2547255.1 GNAT family N-acetyltransferase [Hymenobacter translucens]